MKNKTIGYLRVSTEGQNIEKNKTDIRSLANEKGLSTVEFIDETVTGTKSWENRKLKTIVDDLTKGDNIVVSELSRLGRSILDIMLLLKVCKEKEINIYSVKEHWELNNGGIQGKIIVTLYSMFAEIERDLISQRTREGLRAAIAKGHFPGRPTGPGKSKLDKYRPEIEALLKNGSTKSFIANRYNTTPANLLNWLSKNSINIVPDTTTIKEEPQ